MIVGVVRFGEDIDYASDDAAFARDRPCTALPQNLGRGWVVRAAAGGADTVPTKLKPKYRDFFEAVADAEGPSFAILHPIYGKIASVAVDHIINDCPHYRCRPARRKGPQGRRCPPCSRRAR